MGKTAASRLAAEPIDEWFTMLPDIPVASVLKLYAKVRKLCVCLITYEREIADVINRGQLLPCFVIYYAGLQVFSCSKIINDLTGS